MIYNKVLIVLFLFLLLAQFYSPFISWKNAFIGALTGGGSMFIIALLGKMLFKKESLGMGDVKLAATSGFFIGWQKILIALYAGFVIAFLTIIIINRFKKTKVTGYVPLGPFLALGIIIFLFWGQQLIQLYLSLVI